MLSEFGFRGTLNFSRALKSIPKNFIFFSWLLSRFSNNPDSNNVIFRLKVGYAGTFPGAIDANNYLVTKLCCRHLIRPLSVLPYKALKCSESCFCVKAC